MPSHLEKKFTEDRKSDDELVENQKYIRNKGMWQQVCRTFLIHWQKDNFKLPQSDDCSCSNMILPSLVSQS